MKFIIHILNSIKYLFSSKNNEFLEYYENKPSKYLGVMSLLFIVSIFIVFFDFYRNVEYLNIGLIILFSFITTLISLILICFMLILLEKIITKSSKKD